MNSRTLGMIAVVCLGMSQAGLAGTYYVATTGSDGGAGSSTFPWATLQHAVETIGPGDVIVVRAGTYAGCRIEKSGLATAVKTLMTDAGAQVILNAPGPKNRHNSIIEVENFSATVGYWVINGFDREFAEVRRGRTGHAIDHCAELQGAQQRFDRNLHGVFERSADSEQRLV